MNNQLVKNVLSSEEFKKIKNFDDPKGTVTKLDNLFYGGMALAIPMFLYWMFQIFGKWLFIIPVGYVVACYVGRLIKLVIDTRKSLVVEEWNKSIQKNQNESESGLTE